MKTIKYTLAAAALGALVAFPVTSVHAWDGYPGYGYAPYGLRHHPQRVSNA